MNRASIYLRDNARQRSAEKKSFNIPTRLALTFNTPDQPLNSPLRLLFQWPQELLLECERYRNSFKKCNIIIIINYKTYFNK